MNEETYKGEALDTAMMLARLDYAESEIARLIAKNFPADENPGQLASDAIVAVKAERAEQAE